jgi:hypothetical protein
MDALVCAALKVTWGLLLNAWVLCEVVDALASIGTKGLHERVCGRTGVCGACIPLLLMLMPTVSNVHSIIMPIVMLSASRLELAASRLESVCCCCSWCCAGKSSL